MISVAQSTAASTMEPHDDHDASVELNELGTVDDALEFLSKMVSSSGGGSVRLHCTVPTWCSPSDTCLDLHDLHDLRSRALLFIHNLTESLRSSGIPASYRLAPCNSNLCLVCPISSKYDLNKVKTDAFRAVQHAGHLEREKVLLADLEHGPALIIT
ncbi:hypothetical protein GLOTRDRAFT_135289 [Gloeophyllum trabeum ATCC 11539]|uniref:Uncharacterized protein n=1 Tax=Gloeophyllum trabeum (strain ATCC 11539 / FP-39264 / Madison 617) TaxID=670483 RepID=S7S450_GLOTA|nr:uncharacterized protein GLOTRDRAFT_135289 [Gloeophyllum trabeum ATCC 11539]EPQ60639.1 hypothetical protein GLOTRDRAFT_135289 [Gloeophyllum trabeum ATCC 11539]